jgi:RNA polymerase sigma-70 factor (ECF subfamily)
VSNLNEEHKELWLKFIAGDEGAFASLYNCYANKLFVFGCRFTSNEELVKDCVPGFVYETLCHEETSA